MAKSFPNTGVTTGLAADRTGLTSPFAGMQFFETDTNLLYLYNGSSWIRITSAGVATGTLIASTTTAAITGTYGTDLIATTGPNITLSAGSWMMYGGATTNTTVNIDAMNLRIYNITDSSIVSNSIGPWYYAPSAAAIPVAGFTALTAITITSNKQYCLYLARNGGSTPNFNANNAGSVHFLNAVKIG